MASKLSLSGSTNHSPFVDYKVDWEKLKNEVNKVIGFIQSLNAKSIGTGLVSFISAEFMIKPRSVVFNSHRASWVTNIGHPEARFETVQNGFIQLKAKIEKLKEDLGYFKPRHKDDCSKEAKELLSTLIQAQTIIQQVARDGLKKLCANYREANKDQKAKSLNGIGDDCFNLLEETRGDFERKLLAVNPDLQVNLTLERYNLEAKDLLGNLEDFTTHLRSIEFHPNVVITLELVMDAVSQFNLSKEAVKNGANAISLPKMATPIPTQGGATHWMPFRLVGEGLQGVRLEKGVTGSCETTDNITNFYYRIDSETKQLVISCGIIDTTRKVDQVVFAISEILKMVPKTSGQWVFHQFNAAYEEADLIRDVKKHVPTIEKRLQNLMPDQKVTLLHFHTSFTDKKDDKELQTHANIDSLMLLASLVFNGLVSLLSFPEMHPKRGKVVRAIETNIATLIKEGSDLVQERRGDNFTITEVEGRTKLLNTLAVIKEHIPPVLERLKIANLHQDHPNLLKSYYVLKTFEEILKLQLSAQECNQRSFCYQTECFLFLYRLLGIKPVLISKQGLDRTAVVRALDDTQSQIERDFYESALKKVNDRNQKTSELEARISAQGSMFELIQNLDEYSARLSALNEQVSLENRLQPIPDLKQLNDDIQLTLSFRNLFFEKIDTLDENKRVKTKLKCTHQYRSLFLAHLLGPETEKTLYSTGIPGFNLGQYVSWLEWNEENNPLLQRLPLWIELSSADYVQLVDSSGPTKKTTPAAQTLLLRLGHLR